MVDIQLEFGRAPRVLIADDNVANVELIKMQLKNSAYELECAFDGAQTLDKVKSFHPDIILLDLRMPVEPSPLLSPNIYLLRYHSIHQFPPNLLRL